MGAGALDSGRCREMAEGVAESLGAKLRTHFLRNSGGKVHKAGDRKDSSRGYRETCSGLGKVYGGGGRSPGVPGVKFKVRI